MKKKGTILFVFVLFTTAGFSQLRFGPVAGLTMSKISVDETFTTNDGKVTINDDNARLGFQLGLFARLEISKFYIQPEVLFTNSGGDVEVDGDFGKEVRELEYNKLDIPILLGTDFLKILRIQAGPVFSIMLSDDARDVHVTEQVKNKYHDAVIGYQAGLGLDLGEKIYLDFKYENNLSALGDKVVIGNEEFDTDLRNPQFIFTLGLNLF